jgi:ribonuclease HI
MGNNFAGLPGKSCQEPIHIINAVIEHARESKKECWILSQDMSKAFDLINREMLNKAMIRLNFPNQLRQILLNAFQNRTNQVITDHGLTESYPLNNGVDQGEVFSPLMWCIYYDPLLSYIQSKPELGYTISITLPSNLTTYPYTQNTESTTIADVAFMDDTTWIAPSKEAMDNILSIASSFYKLNSIKVNPDKSSLLTLNPSTPQNETYATFDNIQINPTLPNIPVRILGVWFNSSGSQKHHISSFKNIINSFVSLLYPKKLTGEQMIYILNHVLAPKLEYRYQTTFFSKKECSDLLSPITKLLKNKLGLSRSFPNSVLHHPHFYNLFDYWQLQCQSMVTNFIIRINDSSLIGQISRIQLKQLQQTLWIPFCPLLLSEMLPTKLNHKNITAACITLMISSHISCQFSSPSFISSYNIKGGNVPLINLIPDQYFKLAPSLKKYSILFLEQLLKIDCSSFLPFNLLFHRLPFTKFRRPPKWYDMLKSKLCHPQRNYINPISNISNTNPFIFPSLYKPPSDMRKKPIIASMSDSDLIVVKRSSSTLYRHYKFNNNNTISPCEGCHRSIYSTNAPCTIKNLPNQICLATNRLTSSQSTYKLKIDIADIFYLIQHINNTQTIPTDDIITSNISLSINEQLIQSMFIPSPLQNILSSFAIKNQLLTALTFYTDGSLSHFSQQDIKLSCAWIQTKNINVEHSFSCSLESFPSSTKAELMAIMTALLTCPQHCLVSIYTDSQSSIQLIENQTIHENTRKKFKTKNFSIITSIQHIINTLSLKVIFHKIKAHTGNRLNDLVDSLAKSAPPETLIINPNSIKLHSTISFNQQYVDYPLRSFIKIISYSQAVTKWRTQPILLKIIPPDTLINWSYTEFCLKFSNYSMFFENNSHFYHGSLLSFKYEILHNTLPTIKILLRNYPTLLPPNLKCLYCNQFPENIIHLFTCQANPSINLIPWSTIQQIILSSISNWYSSSQQIQIIQQLQPFFSSNFNNISPVVLAAGIIPSSLSNSIYSIFKSHKKTSIILHHISYNLIVFYYKSIWLPRCSLLNTWLKQNNINLKTKTSNQIYPPTSTISQNPSRNHISPNLPTNSHLTLLNNLIKTGSNFLLPR